MMIQENAVLIFEDLNIGFKRGRQKIEKQVYQKLELALIQKLNYLVNKDAVEGLPGHYSKAYQLTPHVNTPQDIGKQCGVVFYVSPGYTSLTCPKCGYRKNVSFNFENIEGAKKLIKGLKLSISLDRNGYIVQYITADKKYTLPSSGIIRLRWHRSGTEYAKQHRPGESEKSKSETGVTKEYDITECLKGLLDEYKNSVNDLTFSDSADFYRHLFRYLDLMLRSRNSISGTDIDYIQCPRCHFRSDDRFQGHAYNGDANGAYNIAWKGLLALRKIQHAKEPEKVQWGDLKIDVAEWDEAMTKRAEENGIKK